MMQTMQMIKHFLPIQLLKLNLYSIAWSKQQEVALASMWMQIKQNTYVFNEKEQSQF